MALKNLFDMVKADRYTQDGREELIKAQEAETEDKVYQIGEISQKTGLQKTANGWVKPKNGKQPGAKQEEPKNVHGAEVDKIYERQLKRIKELKAKGFTDEQIDNDKIIKQTKEDMKNVGKKPESKPAEKHPPMVMPKGMSPAEFMKAWEDDAKKNGFKKGQGNEWREHLRKEEAESKPAAKSKNKTTIRQGPNTKTLNETPAEHVQKNLDAYTGYSPYDMEELVLKPSGYEKSRSTKGPDGVSSITYKKDGGDDILLFFDKYGELKNAGTSQNREGVMQKMRAAEGYGHMKVVGDYDVYRVTSGPDKGKYKVSKVGSLREVTMSEEKAADFLTSAAGKNKTANKDSAPSLSEIVDRVYNIGEISEKTGLQKTANGWRPVKKGAAGTKQPDESARIAASKEARAKKSQELGQKAAGDFAKYKDLPPVQRKDALGAASHEGISIGTTQRSMEGMGWDLIQADDKVNVYGKPDGSKAIMKHDGKKITEVSYEAPGSKSAESKPDAADQRDQIGGEIKGNLEAAKYYFDKAQSFSLTDPSFKTYMAKAKEYNDKAKAQADDNGFDWEEMHNRGITRAVDEFARQNKSKATDAYSWIKREAGDSAPRQLTGDTRIRVRKA